MKYEVDPKIKDQKEVLGKLEKTKLRMLSKLRGQESYFDKLQDSKAPVSFRIWL